MMNPLDKEEQLHIVVPDMEQRTSLSSNKDVIRCSILGCENVEPSNEILLARLAALILEAYFYNKKQPK
ncbi:hypothetical protein [Mucilaginibacter sp.]|uniref:hypothetical protein n=1 Tax=Mucilaginibacter sp. TaxID=1882438 RepID=UPI0025F6F139|nr:hypothetical protein [Mucilaginibacter sp.]